MKIRILVISFVLLTGLISCNKNKSSISNPYENYAWQTMITDDHPRMFFNEETFKQLKDRALNEERAMFDEMKARIDDLIGKKIEFTEPLIRDGSENRDHEYGFRAAESALLYRILKQEKYLALTKDLLKILTDYYQMRNEAKLNIQWYAFSRVGTLCAYDWIHDYLSKEERQTLGKALLTSINGMIYDGKRERFFRENSGDYKTGYYGPPSLPWYAGLVFFKDGIDDALADTLIRKGYDEYIRLLEYRKKMAGDDGGSATAVLGYNMGAYPLAEFNFFHTFRSATGIDISKEWPYVPDFIYYIYWNWLPENKMFGYGDAAHFDNNIPAGSMHLHLQQMIHFFGETQPDVVPLAKWMQTRVKRQPVDPFPFTRFLLTNTYDEIPAKEPVADIPAGMHFENMGQVFMRSGAGPDDTYAMFSAGGAISQHRHYDNNNFIIYRKGFRALDTGTRPEPGNQLTHYFCRTVAHNCILIHMPGEVMPKYWGGPAMSEENLPIPNDGGQSKILASKIVAYEANEDYVYIASDATESYHPDKSGLVLREFLFLLPDHFVIFDRVISKKPEYKKTWLLHTASEPVISKNEFFEDYDAGRLFCRTIFPQIAKMTKIGGPGKQFWNDGRNWPLPVLTPDDWNYRRASKVPLDTVPLLGQWRIEVSPVKASAADNFLHLIQVGDDSVKSMVDSEKIEQDGISGVKFRYNSRVYEIRFAKEGTGGHITITKDGQKIKNENFTTQVQPQKGLF